MSTFLRVHLMRQGKIACGSNVRGRRSLLSTIALERAEFDASDPAHQCARCSKSIEPKPKAEKRVEYVAIEHIEGESFADFQKRKRAAERAQVNE
jgi:hypothetical protein